MGKVIVKKQATNAETTFDTETISGLLEVVASVYGPGALSKDGTVYGRSESMVHTGDVFLWLPPVNQQGSEIDDIKAKLTRLELETDANKAQQAADAAKQNAAISDLQLALHKASRTSRTNAEVGKVYLGDAATMALPDLPLVSLNEVDKKLEAAITSVHKAFNNTVQAPYAGRLFERKRKLLQRKQKMKGKQRHTTEQGEGDEEEEEEWHIELPQAYAGSMTL
eukprot:CAMPEP_0202892686 /NCGR_PEP_ID=MMETSP1392-20130828/2390_1 /ASSEMBLY_ACC=CAM_ASM_000868 /TAXON_ID=225041 /ORGANISM="Chlamydomonas chlamydogama, Strain SAG 11-48b" /LENGTH=223 /DNA_ID=CAMNT_0049576737 /DNA_START=431 /DNA_END=1099 /DNA_ORIENTATION=+